jgi:hypothetical protein
MGGTVALVAMAAGWWSISRIFGFSRFGLYDDWNRCWLWEGFR